MGHNVSFDRSHIKEQYLLKVSIQRRVCFGPSFQPIVSTYTSSMLSSSLGLNNVFYFLKDSKVRFMDTMSLHMAISGLTGFQRTLWMANKLGKRRGLQEVKEHIKRAGQKRDGPMVRVLFS